MVADALAFRHKIGIVVPSSNTTVQPECEALRPAGVTNHTGRVTIKERPLTSEAAFLEHVQMMRDGLGGAIDQLMTAKPDHLIMGVALEAFWGGVKGSTALQDGLAERAGVGVTMGSTATAAALRAFGATRIAVLTPHQPRGDEQVGTWFREAGFELVRLKGLACASPAMIPQVTGAELRAAFKALDGEDIDALVQVGTGLIAKDVAAEAERWLGKPVLAINVVSYWEALRRLGCQDRLYGQGRILEEF
jgi:maleate isomerase